ncbi:MAG: hypothetical protein ACPG47_06840, partial [Leucothrix sp.]
MGQSNTITRYSAPECSEAKVLKSKVSAQPNNAPTLTDSILNSLTISLVEAPWWISMLALVFTGSLAPYLGQAAFFLIVGGIISMTVISSLSSWKGSIWLP